MPEYVKPVIGGLFLGAIGILSSGAVLVGRLGTGQIPWQNSLILVAGVIIGAQLGSVLSQRTPRVVLRRVLAVVIFATAIKIGVNVFEQYQQLASAPGEQSLTAGKLRG